MPRADRRLLGALAFYGAFHSNPVNQAIHFVFVPCIALSAATWLAYLRVPAVDQLDACPFADGWQCTDAGGAMVLMALYALYYMLRLDAFAGLTWAVCVGYPLVAAAAAWRNASASAWKPAVALHVLGWYMQIHPGHAIFEKRRPALTKSLVQSLVLAPLFVWMELLFLLGYRPALKRDLDVAVRAAQKELDLGKSA